MNYLVPVQNAPLCEYSHAVQHSLAPHALAPDVVALLLQDKRSEQTRRAYASDLKNFFDGEYSRADVDAFLALSPPQLAVALATYKAKMRGAGAAEATINRRLAAVRSLLKFAYRLGMSQSDGRSLVDSEKAVKYRDTRGVDMKTLKKLLAAPAQAHENNTARRRRDSALLTLLIENALRRAEVCKLNVSDFEPVTRTLWILGKGRGTQRERVTLSTHCALCISEYSQHFSSEKEAPLFRNFDHRPEHSGARLTADGLYRLVGEYGRLVGLSRLTPHQLRHSAITAALDATKGDVRRVRHLSRHAKIETLMIYDDARNDAQGEISGLLSGLLNK